MDIEEFFQLCAGKWFTQRTSHNLVSQKSESDQFTAIAEVVQKDAPEVVSLCQQHKLDSACIVGGLRLSPDKPKTEARSRFSQFLPKSDEDKGIETTTLLVLIADADNLQQGKVLRCNGSQGKLLEPSHYVLGNDDSLTLFTTLDKSRQTEERLWFVSDNLRMRTSLLKQSDGVCIASFFSEIRLGAAKSSEPD